MRTDDLFDLFPTLPFARRSRTCHNRRRINRHAREEGRDRRRQVDLAAALGETIDDANKKRATKTIA